MPTSFKNLRLGRFILSQILTVNSYESFITKLNFNINTFWLKTTIPPLPRYANESIFRYCILFKNFWSDKIFRTSVPTVMNNSV